MNILESQQIEIEKLQMENRSLKEQLEESMDLSEQLTSQNQKLQKQIDKLKNLQK